tara:strand:- start:3556 stop:4329 length:774 start_codon:yes stop_codon:yes gene_type:complete
MREKILKITKLKNKKRLVCLTAYSKNIATILDDYCDIILVGDSMANVLYGMENTHKIKMETIINHAISVSKGIKKSLLVVDMPKGTYKNISEAVKNARIILKKTKCDAVKIESNNNNFRIIKKLVTLKIPVMGHVGYTPQFTKKFKVQGSNKTDSQRILTEAKKIQSAGAFSIVLECVKSETSKKITKILKIPTIGIGSSKECDGQILVTDDILGLSGFYPKFVKKYVNLKKIIKDAVISYSKDVIKKKFPRRKNSY